MATSMRNGVSAVKRVGLVPLLIRGQTRPFRTSSVLVKDHLCHPCINVLSGQGLAFRHLGVPSQTFSSNPQRWLSTSHRLCSETSDQPAEEAEQLHSIIQDSETVTGTPENHEFQAETRMLLDIVAKSLYSENEVFIRELISNASDALEKLRYLSLTSGSGVSGDLPLEIHIATNQEAGTFTIQDTGVGMTLQEMIDNLGTIARSGSKAFLEELQKDGQTGSTGGSIVGQFGVGFYSAFMVGDHVDVYSKSHQPDSKAYRWSSDGTGNYDIVEADGVQLGTKIVIHLKKDCWRFAMEADVKEIISKHSTFVGMPIFLNGKLMNTTQALWTKEPREVSDQQHEEFYQFLTHNSYDKPRYTLHYKTDAPLNIRSLFYVPSRPPAMWELSQDHSGGVALYSRRVLIQQKADKILPKWFRFIQGVVDSEDIPLNLSRELLQDSALIRKLRMVITSRLVRFLLDQRKKDPKTYEQFFTEYGTFLREGIISSSEQAEKEEIGKLLCFETSAQSAGSLTSLQDYASRMKAGQRNIYYICAPSRELAESSPYFEAFQRQGHEVLFCYAEYDELTMLQLREFDRKLLTSVESEMAVQNAGAETSDTETVEGSLTEEESDSLITYMKDVLGTKVANVKVTQRLAQHPAMVTVAEMGAARHFLRTALKNRSEEEKLQLLQPTLELNGSHPIVQKLFALKTSEPALARLLSEQNRSRKTNCVKKSLHHRMDFF
ncbi:heat shock protein 75 kDa, mitochondrial-like isoform X2 [Acanthaster planci]|uniref:Heat shock protein 75 kDa, mitochondrial n=1 Tax=Acanthaster planci TaxID=133434 RepID=A0A8B7Y396_ACAPL|nr:heat shock protein 75 kDa, mitochondrial-like isoform X2 [Acanthaster planci]